MSSNLSLENLFKLSHERLQSLYAGYLHHIPSRELKAAIQYPLQQQGKQLRPLLVYATGLIFDAHLDDLTVPAGAVELIHTYSLIHDDLPCMDNAEIRRGQAACHRKFGEGLAVLAGDSLNTLAFNLLAAHPASFSDKIRLEMISVLTKACGPFGMAAGQAFDITLLQNDQEISIDLLKHLYELKTGALFSACLELGFLRSNQENEKHRTALNHFGRCIGLAFQIQDDILDIETPTTALGKIQGIDLQNKKQTYARLVGLQKAKNKVAHLYEEAITAIHYLGEKALLLRRLTNYMLARKK